MSNKRSGTTFEDELCDILFHKGFWCYHIPQTNTGQPADVIAARHGRVYLIDCKVCEHDVFPLYRIEANQRTAMSLWKDSGNGEGLFALKMSDGQIYMVNYAFMSVFSQVKATINRDVISHHGVLLKEWVWTC